jgi:hypothetical protein
MEYFDKGVCNNKMSSVAKPLSGLKLTFFSLCFWFHAPNTSEIPHVFFFFFGIKQLENGLKNHQPLSHHFNI